MAKTNSALLRESEYLYTLHKNGVGFVERMNARIEEGESILIELAAVTTVLGQLALEETVDVALFEAETDKMDLSIKAEKDRLDSTRELLAYTNSVAEKHLVDNPQLFDIAVEEAAKSGVIIAVDAQ